MDKETFLLHLIACIKDEFVAVTKVSGDEISVRFPDSSEITVTVSEK